MQFEIIWLCNDFQFCNLLNCAWFLFDLQWICIRYYHPCVSVLTKGHILKKCVWLICSEYGGLQQIKTVIKIVCKPTISINLKNQTGAVDRPRNLSNVWMKQNKRGNILKHLTAGSLTPNYSNPIFFISLINAPFLDHLRMALPDIILKQSALHISLNEQHCLFCLTIVKFDCLSLPFLVITWTCLSKIGQIWTIMMMIIIIIIITNNMITIYE